MRRKKGTAGKDEKPSAKSGSRPIKQKTQDGECDAQIIGHKTRNHEAKADGAIAAGGDSKDDSKELLELGRNLDVITPEGLWRKDETGRIWERTWRDWWIEENLWIRTKKGGNVKFELNRAQREYSRRCGKQNIVLKARQVGITTYIAARFFVETITRPGMLSMQVAHDRESAEEIFRIVQPGRMRLAEDRLMALEHNDIKRNVYDRIVTAVIACTVSALIALHDHWMPK